MNKILCFSIIVSFFSYSAYSQNYGKQLWKELDGNFKHVEGLQFHEWKEDITELLDKGQDVLKNLDEKYYRSRVSIFGVLDGYKELYNPEMVDVSAWNRKIDGSLFGGANRFKIYRTMNSDVPTHYLYVFGSLSSKRKFAVLEFIHVDLIVAFEVISE